MLPLSGHSRDWQLLSPSLPACCEVLQLPSYSLIAVFGFINGVWSFPFSLLSLLIYDTMRDGWGVGRTSGAAETRWQIE